MSDTRGIPGKRDDFAGQPSPELQGQPTIVKLIGRILAEPKLLKSLWKDPVATAREVGIKLTDEEVKRVQSMPDEVKAKVQQWAKEVQLRPPDGA